MKISTDGRGGSNTAAEILNARAAWTAAIDADGEVRDGAWVAEATDLVGLDAWPDGTRLVLRKERPYPGAQLRFTDSDGHRITGFITDTPRGQVPGGSAGLELRPSTDLVAWTKLLGFREHPDLAWCEIGAFRYRVLHVAARITRVAPAGPDADRCELAVGTRDRGRPATNPLRLHLTAMACSDDTRKAPRTVEPGAHPSGIGHILAP